MGINKLKKLCTLGFFLSVSNIFAVLPHEARNQAQDYQRNQNLPQQELGEEAIALDPYYQNYLMPEDLNPGQTDANDMYKANQHPE